MFAIGEENLLPCGLALLVGAVGALGLGWRRCVSSGVPGRKIALATVLLPLFTVFFSHLLYCLVDVEYILYSYSAGYLFAFWQPGHMFYGGMLGAAIALFVAGGREWPRLMEQYAPGAAWMLAAARVAEGFLGQGYGEYAGGENFFCRFPFMMYDAYYEDWAWALFVLEALIALTLFVMLLKRKPTWQGDGALLLAGLYASAQIVLESLRRDEFLRWGFVRVEEVASAVVILAVLVCYCVKAGGGRAVAKAACFGAFAMLVVFCLLLEFATEGRIPFLMFLDVNACYIAMAGACVLMGGCVLWMRRLCGPRPADA